MFFLRHTTIKGKLITLIMLTTGIALLVSSLLFGMNDVIAFRNGMLRDLRTLAEIIGANARSALDFDDDAAAYKTLSTLQAKPNILAAAIYTKEGNILTNYYRDGVIGAGVPARPGSDGYAFTTERLTLFQPIERDGERFGTIYLLFDMQELWALVRRYAIIGSAILVGALLVALLV